MTVTPLDPALTQRADTPLNQRVTLLSQQHPWMPPDMTSQLASSDESNTSILSIADSIKQSMAKTWDGFTENFDDSVLHKQPSTALTLARFIHGSLGPLPIKQTDLNTIQANLQNAGYGKDLSVNGVWGPDWNTAYNDWASDLSARQLAGDRPGSVSVHHAGHSIFSDLLPSHVINATVGFAKGLAHGVNTLLGDVAGDVVDVPYLLTGHTQQSAAANSTRAWFQNIGQTGTSRVTAQDVARQDAIKRTTQDVLTAIALVPVAGEASAAGRVAAGAFEGGVDMQFAQRGPGVIAKSLFGGLDRQALTEGAARRGILNTRMFQNAPLLRQVGPAVGRLADADGLYYKARTLLATPYALPQVRVAGALGQRYILAGAGLQLGAQVGPHIGVENDITRNIRDTNVMDDVDMALGRMYGNPDSHLFSRAVDTLGLVLHGPLGSTAASTSVGDKVQQFTDGINDFIGHYGAEGAFQRGVAKATGQRFTPINDLHKAFGGEDQFNRFMANKIADLAASHYAQNQAQQEGLAFGSKAFRDRVGQLADDIWNQPDTHQNAIHELLANKTELENRIAADMIHNRLAPHQYTQDLVDDPAGVGNLDNYGSNGVAWMTAGSHVQNILTSGLARHLFGADGRAVIGNAQDQVDFGGEVAGQTRLLDMTRRDYTKQVTTLLTSVRRQVDQARTQLGRQVARAEQNLAAAPDDKSLQGTLAATKQAQQQLEAALDSGDLRVFANKAKELRDRTTARTWDQLVSDATKLRRLVDQGTPEGERLTLTHLLDNGVNPDEMYSNINGLPQHDASIGSGDWMREHLQHDKGVLGLARKDTKTAQQAAKDLQTFQARIDKAATPDDLAKIEADMRNYAFREFGLTERTLGVKDANGLMPILGEHADKLASDVYQTFDAPPELKALLGQIDDQGYKLVLGSHIGHLWDASLPSMPDLKGAIGYRRRVAGAIGVDPTQISSRDAGRDASLRVQRKISELWDNPKFVPPPRVTAETVMQVLRDEKLVEPQLGLPEQVATAVTRRFHGRAIERLAEDRGVSKGEARAIYEQGMATALQLRDLPRSKFIKVLTTPKEGVGPNGPWEWTGMDKQSANLVRRAVLSGYAERPGHIQGFSTLEDWVRGGFSMGGKVKLAYRLSGTDPLSELTQRAAELPNSLVNVRNRLRFTLSPFFDFRRVAKQNAKMSIDGVTPVLNPLDHMIGNGTFDKAHKYLTKLIGEPEVHGFDDADRYLHQQSVWGLYNSRHFEAYYAWEKKAQGATDDEIRQGIRRVFEYGSSRGSGRSPLERSVNTVFFPFSFEKTLLRNTGAYMIDHPQQALLLTGAITAYDDANSHQQVHEWLQNHFPILRDLQKLNAFAHGLSPGEVGGINAPLLNLFMPQKWDGGLTKKNLQRFLPIWNDFGQLLHDAREQAVIGRNAVENAADYAITLGAPRNPLDPYRPTITPEAQQRQAVAMRNQAIIAWTDVLDYNLHQHSDANKYTFPNDPRLPTSVRGKVVNRTNIGYLVKIWYPAYDPGEARRYAEQQQEKAQQYVDGLTDPTKRQQYGVFVNLANVVQGHLYRGDYDTPTAVAVMNNFRQVAANASETDPQFYKFYNSNYRWLFGPLEEVTP